MLKHINSIKEAAILVKTQSAASFMFFLAIAKKIIKYEKYYSYSSSNA